jgi:hypothetical protein
VATITDVKIHPESGSDVRTSVRKFPVLGTAHNKSMAAKEGTKRFEASSSRSLKKDFANPRCKWRAPL